MNTQIATSAVINWVPGQADIAFYREHGWFVSPVILPDEVLDSAEEAIRLYYQGHRDHELPEWTTRFDWKPEHGNVLKLNNYLCLQMDAVRALIMYPTVGRTAAYLAETPAVRLYKDSAIVKPPSAGNAGTKVGWHTDKSYWLMCSADNMLTAWIPFQDSDEGNGSLAVIDGSHLWPLRHELRSFGNQDTHSFEEEYGRQYELKKRVLTVRRGQVSFHDCRLLHGSMENNSAKERTVLAVHLQPHENHYRVYPDANGKPLSHLNDFICKQLPDGTPDYADQEIFPELWRKQNTSFPA
jgi:hypothetical protein